MDHNPWLLVDGPAKAKEALKDIAHSDAIGIDTEYDSLRYFREKLCLIQIKADKKTYLFDPLGDCDLSVLGEHFASPSIRKVLHAGDNDIRLLRRDYNFVFNNIFDTHRAASLLGCSRLSLATLVGEYLGIAFEKKKAIQRSKWDRRPLSEEQLQYAVLDTAYLMDLYRRLEELIAERGLQEEVADIFSEMANAKWRKKGLKQDGHKHVDRYYTLTDRQKDRLKRLFRWRYGKAQEINRAIFMVLSDQDLVHLSGLEVGSLHDLMQSDVLPAEKLHLFGQDIVELLTAYEGTAGCLL